MQGMRKKWFCMLAGVALLFVYSCGGNGDGGTPTPTPPGEVVVETLQATNVTVTGATLRGTVNPNGLDNVTAYFEWGYDSTLAGAAGTPDQPVSGDNTVNVSATITGLSGDNTVYFRIVASDADGPEVKGEILSFDPLSPPPVADAGTDQQVFMGQEVTLDGSGSDTPAGTTITTYLWEQVSGTPVVTLSDNGAVSPTFTAPATVPPQGVNLVFQLTVTNNRGQTDQDTVTVQVLLGALEDFSTDTRADYDQTTISIAVPPVDPPPPAQFNYDEPNGRVQVITADDLQFSFGKDSPATTDNAVFSFDFTPIGTYPTGGGIWVRLIEDADNYYELAIFNWDDPALPGDDAYFAKVVGGVEVDSDLIPMNNYDNVTKRTVTITFAPASASAAGFLNGPATLTSNNTAINVQRFEILTSQQDAYYDNIQFKIVP